MKEMKEERPVVCFLLTNVFFHVLPIPSHSALPASSPPLLLSLFVSGTQLGGLFLTLTVPLRNIMHMYEIPANHYTTILTITLPS